MAQKMKLKDFNDILLEASVLVTSVSKKYAGLKMTYEPVWKYGENGWNYVRLRLNFFDRDERYFDSIDTCFVTDNPNVLIEDMQKKCDEFLAENM